jgi:hypothetical protein
VTENISSWLDVVYAANLKPGDRLAGYYVPDAPTRPVQPVARALTLTEVTRYDDNGKAMMRLRSGDLNLSPARAMANALVIRIAEHPAEEPAEQPAVDSSAAAAGRCIVTRLLQLEERLAAHYPRAARDGHVASVISAIRDEADALTQRFEFIAPTGQCAHCGAPDVALVAALADDTDQLACQSCHDDGQLHTIALEALRDDTTAYAITRGDLVASAGQPLTDDEVRHVAACLAGTTDLREAIDGVVWTALVAGEDGHP